MDTAVTVRHFILVATVRRVSTKKSQTVSGQLVFFNANLSVVYWKCSYNKATKTLSLEMVTKSK